VGERVGTSVVGSGVGCGEGSKLGFGVGSADGRGVGLKVGSDVGILVGTNVGTGVGRGVGNLRAHNGTPTNSRKAVSNFACFRALSCLERCARAAGDFHPSAWAACTTAS
jgi:phage tail tape-measure protein